jgi:hypothetical protein
MKTLLVAFARALTTATLLMTPIQLAGCMTTRLIQGERGADTSSLRIGATRAEVETSFGPCKPLDTEAGLPPCEEFGSTGGVHHVAYVYDGGRPPHPAQALVLAPFVGVNESLGLPFAMYSGDPCAVYGPKLRPRCEASLRHELWRVVVGYDEAGKVVEISEPKRVQY